VRRAVAAALAIALAACGTPGPTELGNGIYRVSARSTLGSAADSEKMARDQAHEHCAKSRSEVQVTNQRDGPNGRVDMTYRCVTL